MSVRAYRVVEIISEEPSFNVYHDHKLVQFLETESEAGFYAYLNSYGSGLVDVPIRVLERAVRMSAKLDLGEEIVKRLKQDIAAAKSNKDESVTYNCF